jgi:glycerol-3-phosphate dehydrogenase
VLRFDAETRRANLVRMADRELELLVVGGGITGAGIALDAAARGFSVGLVERDDFAAGTSGRSSRLIHGGVRYLEQYEFGLVHEGLRERAILLRTAPHLVHAIPMYIPVPGFIGRAYRNLGLTLYDGLATGRNIRWHHRVGPTEMARVCPGLGAPTRGLKYMEARTDDARLTLEVVRTAAAHGALIANHAEVVGLLGEGRVAGAKVVDRTTDEGLEVRARVVANAAGVWTSGVQATAGVEPARLRPSKGVHLVFRPGAVDIRTGMVIPSGQGDGRWLFLITWGDRVYAGTTDTPYEGDLDEPTVDGGDLAYVVGAVANLFPSVSERDVVASWAGLRPLLDRGERSTADLSRRHAISEDAPGLLTISGGKLTAYRAMAQDLVDVVQERLGTRVASPTRAIPLGLTSPLEETIGEAMAAAPSAGVSLDTARRMVLRFGDDWRVALAAIAEDPSLGEPAVEGLPVLRVELELARTREMALTEEDALIRRTRLRVMDETATVGATT